jgi:hypothetical protein
MSLYLRKMERVQGSENLCTPVIKQILLFLVKIPPSPPRHTSEVVGYRWGVAEI